MLSLLQVGGLGVKDYSGRAPNQEQLEDVVCKSDPKPGFTFVLDNFAELLEDTFLQNLTTEICKGKHTDLSADIFYFNSESNTSINATKMMKPSVCVIQIRNALTTNVPVSMFLIFNNDDFKKVVYDCTQL